MANIVTYGTLVRNIVTGSRIRWTSDTIKVMLCKSTYIPDPDTDYYESTPAAHEVSGPGYTAGGVALSGRTVTYDAATNTVILDAGDVVFSNISVVARYAVIYQSYYGSGILYGYIDFGGDIAIDGELRIIWSDQGIFRFTAI